MATEIKTDINIWGFHTLHQFEGMKKSVNKILL